MKPYVLLLFKDYEVSSTTMSEILSQNPLEYEIINHFQIQLSTSSTLALYVACCLRVNLLCASTKLDVGEKKFYVTSPSR